METQSLWAKVKLALSIFQGDQIEKHSFFCWWWTARLTVKKWTCEGFLIQSSRNQLKYVIARLNLSTLLRKVMKRKGWSEKLTLSKFINYYLLRECVALSHHEFPFYLIMRSPSFWLPDTTIYTGYNF